MLLSEFLSMYHKRKMLRPSDGKSIHRSPPRRLFSSSLGPARSWHHLAPGRSRYIDATLKHIEGVISYFKKYRDEGFYSSIDIAKGLASDMDIEPKFSTKCKSKRKKHFVEINDEDEELQLSAMESVRVLTFLSLLMPQLLH